MLDWLLRSPSSRALACASVIAGSTVAPRVQPVVAAAQQAQKPPGPKTDLVVMRVCVDGPTLTTMPADTDGGGPARTYRLAGARQLVKQLEGEHAGHLEEITGRVKGEFAPPTGRRVGRVGKVGIVIGARPSGGRPNVPQVPEMPSIEVKSFRHLEDRCPR